MLLTLIPTPTSQAQVPSGPCYNSTSCSLGTLAVTGGIANTSLPESILLSNCKCDGSTDDTAAVNAFLQAHPGATISIPANTKIYIGSGNLTPATGQTIIGQGSPFGITQSNHYQAYPSTSAFVLNPAYSVVMAPGDSLSSLSIYRNGLATSPTDAQVISAVSGWGADNPPSIGITIPALGAGARLEHLFIEGFTWCIADGGPLANGSASPGSTVIAKDIKGDCYNGGFFTDIGDQTTLEDINFEPYYAISSPSATPGESLTTSSGQGTTGTVLQFAANTLGNVQVGDYVAIVSGSSVGYVKTGPTSTPTTVASINNGAGQITLSQATATAVVSGTHVTFGGAWARPGVGFYLAGPQENTTGLQMLRDFAFMYRTGMVEDGVGSIILSQSWVEWQQSVDPAWGLGYGTVGYRIMGPAGDTTMDDNFANGYSVEFGDETSNSPISLENFFANAPGLGGANAVPSGATTLYLGGLTDTPITETISGQATASGTACMDVASTALVVSPQNVCVNVVSGQTAVYVAQNLDLALNTNLVLAQAHAYNEISANFLELTLAFPAAATFTVTGSVPTGLTITSGTTSAIQGSIGQINGVHQTSSNTSIPFLTAAPHTVTWHIANVFISQTIYNGWTSIDNSDHNQIDIQGYVSPILPNANIVATGGGGCTNGAGTARDTGGAIYCSGTITGGTITYSAAYPLGASYCTISPMVSGASPITIVSPYISATELVWTNSSVSLGSSLTPLFSFQCKPDGGW